MRALTFPAGDVVLALPLAAAREVVPGPALTRLPTAPPAVLGLIDVRGETIPLFDVALMLGSGHASPSFAAVVECEQGLAGIATGGPVATVVLPEELAAGSRAELLGIARLPDGGEAAVLDLGVLFHALPALERP